MTKLKGGGFASPLLLCLVDHLGLISEMVLIAFCSLAMSLLRRSFISGLISALLLRLSMLILPSSALSRVGLSMSTLSMMLSMGG